MTFDRKYKKDSFYAYKAWLSDDPFVHLCGKRYVNRVEDVTKVTVYSNLPEVELFANGESLGKLTAEDHFFYFQVPNKGETTLVAVAGDQKDESFIRKVAEFNNDYRLKEQGAILNWFDITEVEGYMSLNTRLDEVMKVPAGMAIFGEFMGALMGGAASEGAPSMASADMLQMLGSFTMLRLIGMLPKQEGSTEITKEMLLAVNEKLNAVKLAD